LHEGALGPNDVVAPHERLSWGKTAGLGAQHVVAMFGATFVFPLIMGLNAQLAIMMSGIATIAFLLIVQGKVPSYLGTSASFVGGVAAIRGQGGDSPTVTGAILIAGVVLALVGVAIHFLGSGIIHTVLPPVVTGAVVMLIGFNLAPRWWPTSTGPRTSGSPSWSWCSPYGPWPGLFYAVPLGIAVMIGLLGAGVAAVAAGPAPLSARERARRLDELAVTLRGEGQGLRRLAREGAFA
jgi:Permease family